MSDKPPTIPPASEPFPGSRTPGWNDPPTLQYSPLAASNSGSGRPRLNLNKRVAFPLQGMGGSAGAKPTAIVQPNQSGMPPPHILSLPPSTSAANNNQPIAVVHPMPNINATTISAPRVPPTIGNTDNNRMSATSLPNDVQETTFRCLRDQAAQVTESMSVKREEIERRLGLIEQLWQSGNLSAGVQQKIFKLAQAIENKSFKEAMDVYSALVMNHSNDCATWAIALRHVVLSLQPINSIDSDSTTTTTAINESNVPAMFVPAMPRATSSSSSLETDSDNLTQADTSGHSTVQHI